MEHNHRQWIGAELFVMRNRMLWCMKKMKMGWMFGGCESLIYIQIALRYMFVFLCIVHGN